MVYNVINKINMNKIDNIIQETISECVNERYFQKVYLMTLKTC